MTVFVKLLSSTCDTLQLPLHVVPLLNFLKRNTQVISRKKSSLNSSSSQGRTVLWSNWLSVCLMNSESHSASISPSRQQWLSSHQSSCANQTEDNKASILPLSSILEEMPGSSIPLPHFVVQCLASSFHWYIQAVTVFQRETWGARLQCREGHSLLEIKILKQITNSDTISPSITLLASTSRLFLLWPEILKP